MNIVTKLTLPRVRPSHVARPRLLSLLDTGVDRKLILIAAAAGFGKTTLVAEWSSRHRVAWVALDEGDNDPIRLLSYLIGAIQTHTPAFGQDMLAALQSPQPPPIDHILPLLINQLAHLSERLILVLDDYHVINDQQVVAFLLDYLPSQVTVVLLTRADPPLPLARLRAKNELLELRVADLRFSMEETAQFFQGTMGLHLSPDTIHALEARTEGWIAGLQLAALALHGDEAAFVRDFTGSHRFVLDYLMEEVLGQQPDEVRRFLLQTSILERLNGGLCAAVAGEGQAMLDYLEKNNLFLIPLDSARYWYRYHHLFGDLLRARLLTEYPEMLTDLYQRAADWHEGHGLIDEAIGYALAAKNFEDAARLMLEPAANVVRRGEISTLLMWYKAFPSDFLQEHPRLTLQFGLAFALNGRWAEAEALIQHGDVTRPDEALLRAYFVGAQLPDIDPLDRVGKLLLGTFMAARGNLVKACQLLEAVRQESEREGDTMLGLTALFHRCRLEVFRGNLRQAYEMSWEGLRQAKTIPMATFAHLSLGRIWIEWNEPESAETHLTEAIRLGERSGFLMGVISSATMMLAEVKQVQGNRAGALETAKMALTYAERYDPPAEVFWLKTYLVRLWLAQGQRNEGVTWLHQYPPSILYPHSIPSVTQARVLVAQRHYEAAITMLTAHHATDLLTVEAWAVLALARQGQGDHVHALLALEQAVGLAEAENRVRVFLDLGQPMATLLGRTDHPFAQKLLSLFPTLTDAVDPFGERELEVLRLIVAGYSNDEIAQRLTIALSTVKWYINTLYAKLQVKTRSQAIAKVHELKLL